MSRLRFLIYANEAVETESWRLEGNINQEDRLWIASNTDHAQSTDGIDRPGDLSRSNNAHGLI